MDLACAHHSDRPARARCVECGASLCGACRVRVAGRNWCRPCVPAEWKHRIPGRRVPPVAALLSVVPGLGQMYVGRVARGVVFLVAALALGANRQAVPDPLPLFFWVFNLFDAYSLALSRNSHVAAVDLTGTERHQRRFFALFGLAVAGFAVARLTVAPALDAGLLWPAGLGLYALFLVTAPARERRDGAASGGPLAAAVDGRTIDARAA